MSENGRALEPFEYRVDQTPVPSVIEHGVCRVPDRLTERYPDEPFFREHGLASYLGIRLAGDFGGASGVMTIMHDRAMPNAATVERVMRFFLARTTAELERVHQIKELQRLRRQLARQDPAGQDEPHAARSPDGFTGLDALLTHFTGERLLSDLADAVCRMFDARFCGVCVWDEVDGEPAYLTLAFSEAGRRLDPMQYTVAGTPCEQVDTDGYYCAERGVADRFPNDRWLKDLGIESYFGIRLQGAEGEHLGVLWMVDDKPQADPQRIERTLRYLAPRVGAEVQAMVQIERLREANERFESNASD